MKSFNDISRETRHSIQMFENMLDEGITAISERNGRDIVRALHWKAEHLMKISERLRWLDEVALRLEASCWDAALSYEVAVRNGLTENAASIFDEGWFNDQADRITRSLLSSLVDRVWRAVEFSSNPLTIIGSTVEVEACKATIESLTGRCYSLFSWESINDLVDGIQKRDCESEERQKLQITKVELVKGLNGYSAIATNRAGEVLKRTPITATRRKEARSESDGWAKQLEANQRAAGNNVSITTCGV